MSSCLVDLMNKMSITKFDVESSHWVDVTHINQPDNFYVRPTAYRTYLKILEESGGHLDAPKIKVRAIVAFPSKKKSHIVRGCIYNVLEENGQQMCQLYALDYGFMETMPASSLQSTKHDRVPGLANLCQLADCYPKGKTYDKDSIEAMIFYVGKERAKMIVKAQTSEKLIVQLINTCPEDISTMMALTGYSTLGYGQNMVSRMPTLPQPKVYYTYKQLKVGDTIKIRVQSGDTLDSFFVCDVNDYAAHVAGYDDFSLCVQHEQSLRDEDLTVGKAVAVHNGLKFERAIITDAGGPARRPVALLVDWGKTMQITADSRPKALDGEIYFDRPALAIYCSTTDNSWNNGLPRFLHPGYVFMIKIKKVGKELKSPNIVNIFKNLK